MNLILNAATFAAEAHVGQRRKYHNSPYINHLLRVAYSANASGLSGEAVAAALLHDILEDTEISETDLLEVFSKEIVGLVKLLTKWWPDQASGHQVELFKTKYYRAISENEIATSLKLLDRADNLLDFARSLPAAFEEATKYLQQTHEEFPQLAKCCKNEKAKAIYEDAVTWLSKALAES